MDNDDSAGPSTRPRNLSVSSIATFIVAGALAALAYFGLSGVALADGADIAQAIELARDAEVISDRSAGSPGWGRLVTTIAAGFLPAILMVARERRHRPGVQPSDYENDY